MNYKDTLNLPQTGFPMKASLVEREPQRLEPPNLKRSATEAQLGLAFDFACES